MAAVVLLLQVASPIWTALLLLDAGPPADTPICTAHDPADGERAPAHDQLVVCPLCALVGHAFYSPPTGAVTVALPASAALVVHEHYRASSPRGPPQLAANARAPPILL